MRSVSSMCFAVMCLCLLLACCDREVGNPAPPRIESTAKLPQHMSTIVVPVSVSLNELEARLNQVTPKTLWSINRLEPKCIPAQSVEICAVRTKKCKGKECANVGCKIGIKKTKITPDVSCRIVGQVTRGAINLSGSGERLIISMPVNAVVRVRDLGGVIKQETATGSANVRAQARIWIDNNWSPAGKVDIAYDWREQPGIDVLGRRINFTSKADAQLQSVIAGLERSLPRELGKLRARSQLAEAWRAGFTTLQLNRDKPPAWMRITPQRVGILGYAINGREVELRVATEALTETFIGDEPDKPAVTPLPAPSKKFGAEGLRFYLPVLADYRQLEPVVERALGKLAKKGISLPGAGSLDVEFGKVTIYATKGNRLAVGIRAKARIHNSPLRATKGEIWLTGIPYNSGDSQLIRVRDLKVAARTDKEAINLLFLLFNDPDMLAEVQTALVQDFSRDYEKVITAARKAVGGRREGDFLLSAGITDVRHGNIQVTGQGLFLAVDVSGNGTIAYSPLRRK